MSKRLLAERALLGILAMLVGCAAGAEAPPAATYQQLLAALPAASWRHPASDDLLYLDLEGGRAVILLSNDYAPRHAANLRLLARAHYFDGSTVMRVQDDYVTQWGNDDAKRALPSGVHALAPEFDRAIAADLPFTPLPDGDVYAPLVGHTRGFPVARDPATGRTWLAHCYGMVGVGRDLAVDSATGEELYVVIGHAPRHLDRNVTLVGRVLLGMELLAALPRGGGEMGFYTDTQRRPRVLAMRLESDVPAGERVPLEVVDTVGADYAGLVEARRNRRDEFFKTPAGHIDLCNAPLPVRLHPAR